MISIVITAFKKEKYISQTIASVLRSDYKDFELIIIDDGSPDDTKTVVKKWLDKDSRISYYYQNNQGVCAARNNGAKLAKGTYIMMLDADDLIGKHYISLAINAFVKNPDLSLVYCNAAKFSDKSFMVVPWFLGEYEYSRLLGMNVIPSYAIMKRSTFQSSGGFDESMTHGLEDWELYIRLLDERQRIYRLDYYGYYYRTNISDSRHSQFNSNKDNIKLTLEYIYNKHKLDYEKFYRDMPFEKLSQITYYQYKVDRLEFFVKSLSPRGFLKLIRELLLMQLKK